MVEFIYSFYDQIFGGLLTLNGHLFGARLTVFLFAIVVSVITSAIYKYLTNQEEMRGARSKLKELKKKMDEAKQNNRVKDMSKYMNESLELNHKMMKNNLKPMIASFVLIFLFLPWLHDSFDQTVGIGEEFSYLGIHENIISQNGSVFFNGEELFAGEFLEIEDMEWEIRHINDDNVRLSLSFIRLPFSLPLIGQGFEWLGFYVILSIPATIISRKLLGVY